MPRVPVVDRDALEPADREIYDRIAQSRGKEFARQGPFGVLLHSPDLAGRTAHLGTYVRYDGPMPARHRHLLAMIVARELDCQYEFTAHAVLARRNGLSPAVVEAIGRGEAPTGLDPTESALVAFVRELVVAHRVEHATFERLQDRIGLRGLTDVVGATGYFAMAAHVLNAFEVEVRDEQTPELPPRP